MLTPQYLIPLHHELVVDLFAGGGGASTGIEQAIGRPVDIAINHDPEAVALHQANHPQTVHFVSDVFEVDPIIVTEGRPVGLLWASPDCKHFSKAKGGKPVSKKIRSLAWVVVKWAKLVRPRVIHLENVEEFQTWGPLARDGRPCPQRKGKTFQRWVQALRGLGYAVEWRELRACDYGAPTIRKRLFLVARRDGQPIAWPEPTHAAPGSLPVRQKRLQPWRTAAECIDWTIPAPSIFERSKPLADATCRRIAKGIMRYVVDAAEPFIVRAAHGEPGNGRSATPSGSARKPGSVGCGSAGRQIDVSGAPFVPTLAHYHADKSERDVRASDLRDPLKTQTTENRHALVTAFLAKHYGGVVGSDLGTPIGTVTSVDHHSLVAAHMVTIDNQSSQGGHAPVSEPLKTTVTENRHALVHAFLLKYYSTDQDPQMGEPLHTITTRDRFGLVTVHGEPYAIVDIGLRMLTPRELYRAQGFPESYLIDRGADGRALTKTAQVRMCGNSVCPPLARALVAANYAEMGVERIAA